MSEERGGPTLHSLFFPAGIDWDERNSSFTSYLLGGIAMPDKVMPGPVTDLSGIREAVCIHTRKIYDSCRDKDSAPLRYLGTRKT